MGYGDLSLEMQLFDTLNTGRAQLTIRVEPFVLQQLGVHHLRLK